MDPKIKRALSAIAIEHPFFAALALRKPWIADPDLDPPTMATLPQEYRYHPNFVTRCTMPEVLGVELNEPVEVRYRDGGVAQRSCLHTLLPIENGFPRYGRPS